MYIRLCHVNYRVMNTALSCKLLCYVYSSVMYTTLSCIQLYHVLYTSLSCIQLFHVYHVSCIQLCPVYYYVMYIALYCILLCHVYSFVLYTTVSCIMLRGLSCIQTATPVSTAVCMRPNTANQPLYPDLYLGTKTDSRTRTLHNYSPLYLILLLSPQLYLNLSGKHKICILLYVVMSNVSLYPYYPGSCISPDLASVYSPPPVSAPLLYLVQTTHCNHPVSHIIGYNRNNNIKMSRLPHT